MLLCFLSEHTSSSLGGSLALSCMQMCMMFSPKATKLNRPQKTARECLKVSQRTPRLRERPSKDAQELLKRATGDLWELPGSAKVLLQALRMGKTLIQRPQESLIISSAAPLHVNLTKSWNPGSSNPPSLGRRNARSDWTWPRGGTESALLNLLSKCLYLLPS